MVTGVGVIIYHKTDLPAINRPDLSMTINTVTLQLSISSKKVFFVCSYRRSGQTRPEYEGYCEKINDMLEKISSEDPFCTILTGDFNAHNQKWYSGERTTDKYGKDMQEIFEKNNLYQTVDQPTYIIGESKT